MVLHGPFPVPSRRAAQAGNTYRIAVVRQGTQIYFFRNGTLLNLGGTYFPYTIDSTPNAPFYLGSDAGGGHSWDGYLDEIRISDIARYTANYTPTALTYGYQPSGSIFTTPYDFGTDTEPGLLGMSAVVPANTSIVEKVRAASSATDESTNDANFSSFAPSSTPSRYQQFEIALSDNNPSGAVSPQVAWATAPPQNATISVASGGQAGTAMTASAAASDPGAATLSYGWTVAGTSEAFTGTGANFTFTPHDEGSYTASMVASDTSGGEKAAAPATIAVQGPTSTTVTASVDPSVYGQAVTFTATVAAGVPGADTPTGVVTFLDGSATLGTGTLGISNGVTSATLSTNGLAAGSHTITASYSGDANFTASVANALTQMVHRDATTSLIATSINPTVYGQPVTFTATVSASAPASGAPRGP